MALFRNMLEPMALDESLNPENYQQTLLPQPERRGGLLGSLSDPRIRAMLAGVSQSLAQAGAPSLTPKGTGFGAALSAGIQGANTGLQSYEESLAKQAADAFNQRIKEAQLRKAEQEANGQPTPWDTDLGREVGLLSRQIKAQNPELSDEDAQFQALDIVRKRPFDLLDKRMGGQRELISYQDELRKLQEKRSAEVAAEVAKAESLARGEAERQSAATSQAEGSAEMLDVVSRAEKIAPRASSSSVQSMLNKGLAAVGVSTDSAVADRQLSMLGTELLASQAKSKILGSNPSQSDAIIYEKLAGQIEQPGPLEGRMAALNELKARFGKMAAKGGATAAKPQGGQRSREDILKAYGVTK